MTTLTNQITRSCGTWLVCGMAGPGPLMAGCVSNGQIHATTSPVRIITDQPVKAAFSANALKAAKSSGTMVLALPNNKLSSDDQLGVPATHHFQDNGDEESNWGREGNIGGGANEEDSDSRSLVTKSRTCLDWIAKHKGDPSCYSVTKLGNRLPLKGKRRTFIYQTTN